VTFDIDANGIVNVSAKDRGTGKEQRITITASSGLSDSDIEKMVQDAEAHRSEDQERRKKVEVHNRLEALIYSTEKSFEEHKEKLSAGDLGTLNSAIEAAKKALEAGDLAGMESAEKQLIQASHALAQHMYAGADAGAQAGPAPGAEPGAAAEGEVIDAEYVEDKKN
jgi:molecular chaperone DnaK